MFGLYRNTQCDILIRTAAADYDYQLCDRGWMDIARQRWSDYDQQLSCGWCTERLQYLVAYQLNCPLRMASAKPRILDEDGLILFYHSQSFYCQKVSVIGEIKLAYCRLWRINGDHMICRMRAKLVFLINHVNFLFNNVLDLARYYLLCTRKESRSKVMRWTLPVGSSSPTGSLSWMPRLRFLCWRMERWSFL